MRSKVKTHHQENKKRFIYNNNNYTALDGCNKKAIAKPAQSRGVAYEMSSAVLQGLAACNWVPPFVVQ